MVALCSQAAFATVQEDDALQASDAVFEQWVETERLISKERQDWVVGKEVLQDRIALVRAEIASLREQIQKAEENIEDADEKRAEMLAESDALEKASEELTGEVGGLERRMKELLGKLPEPAMDRVRPLALQMPKDPEETEKGLGSRFQNVVGILDQVNRFNTDIHQTSEVRQLGDGTSAEVTTLYVGIGQAYYVNATAEAAGIGGATPEGWAWQPANQAAAEIQRAIAMLKGEDTAGFVQVPLQGKE